MEQDGRPETKDKGRCSAAWFGSELVSAEAPVSKVRKETGLRAQKAAEEAWAAMGSSVLGFTKRREKRVERDRERVHSGKWALALILGPPNVPEATEHIHTHPGLSGDPRGSLAPMTQTRWG